jgi:hypothetical protein
MTVMAQVPDKHPLKQAWDAYQNTDDFANTKKWARDPEHLQGSLWAIFLMGWTAAIAHAAGLHDSVDPASDEERQNKVPGAGAMGAVIEYRDTIRKSA